MKNGTLIIIDQKNFIGILHLHKKVNEKWQPQKKKITPNDPRKNKVS